MISAKYVKEHKAVSSLTLLSFVVMALLSRKNLLGTVGVSICGGVAHNIGQLLMAMLVLETQSVWYYFPVLLISGSVAGVLIGLLGGWMTGRVRKFLSR